MSPRHPGPKAALENQWTEKDIESLKKLWGDGNSAGQIVLALKSRFSRAAVSGKIHRLGMKRALPDQLTRGRKAAPKARKPLAVHGNRQVIVGVEFRTAQTQEERQRDDAGRLEGLKRFTGVVDGSEPILWTERAFSQCQWPVDGEGADTRSCGGQRDGERIYCVAHAALAFQPSKHTGAQRSDELARSLRRYG